MKSCCTNLLFFKLFARTTKKDRAPFMEIFQSYLVGEPERKITKAFVRRAGNFAKFVWLPDLRLAFVSAGTETLEKLFIFRVLVVTFPLR